MQHNNIQDQKRGSGDIRDITLNEIKNILKDMKNTKSSWADGISVTRIKIGETVLLKILCKLYNVCLKYCTTPEVWNNVIVILIVIYKKGDNTD